MALFYALCSETELKYERVLNKFVTIEWNRFCPRLLLTSMSWDGWPSSTNCWKGDAGRRDVSDKCSSMVVVGYEGGWVRPASRRSPAVSASRGSENCVEQCNAEASYTDLQFWYTIW
jgi:hypothetical protein